MIKKVCASFCLCIAINSIGMDNKGLEQKVVPNSPITTPKNVQNEIEMDLEWMTDRQKELFEIRKTRALTDDEIGSLDNGEKLELAAAWIAYDLRWK